MASLRFGKTQHGAPKGVVDNIQADSPESALQLRWIEAQPAIVG
jgi:hypothetical protein